LTKDLAPRPPIRILVVEDSPVCRDLLVAVLQSVADFQVIAVARDGAEGVRLVRRLQPDLVTMDIHMPHMNGYEATRQIMQEMPRPIVMISDSAHNADETLSFDAINAGALSVLPKPTIADTPRARRHLINQLRLMAEVKVIRHWSKSRFATAETAVSAPVGAPVLTVSRSTPARQIVAIAASTGGPKALAYILKQLPADFPLPILVVQHVTTGFGDSFAHWLDGETPLRVRLARQNDDPQSGEVLVAPDDYHMIVNPVGLIAFNQAPPQHGLRPAADYLFVSVADVYGKTAVGVVLTGMGQDGASGLKWMRASGAHVIAQDEASSTVFGMPAAAIAAGAVDEIRPLTEISQAILGALQPK